MSAVSSTPSPHAQRGWIPWLILAIGLLLTAAGAIYVQRVANDKDLARFQAEVQEAEDSIRDRIDTYTALLRGAAGLFAASRDVAPDEFHTYVERLELTTRYPGIQGIGFTLHIPAERKDAITAEMRRRGITTTRGGGEPEPFTIWPDQPRDDYHAIIYLGPLDRRNHAAIGYDMFTEPIRRDAMTRARDTARAAATGRVQLVQEIDEQKQWGFLIYVPVYSDGTIPETIGERRQGLMGFAYSPFRVDDFLQGVFADKPNLQIAFRVYDGNTLLDDTLLHESARLHGPDPADHRPRFTAQHVIPVAGRVWTLSFVTRPHFETAIEAKLVPLISLLGLLATGILFFLSRDQARALRERDAAQQERLRLLEREQDARREAERANRLKDEFLATVSHELRTPLTAILGWAQLLRTGKLDQETIEQAIEAIERSAKAQSHLVEDLLDVSRIIAGKLRLHVQRLDLAAVIDAALDTLRPAADARQIRVQTTYDPSVGPFQGDPARLQQVVWNLLSNAIKFTPEGGQVRVTLQRSDAHIDIAVGDTGRGIGPAFLPYVFDPFRQADGSTTRKHSGLGLGLAIVKHLVELHGGTVQAHSDGEGRGATFTVRLPIKAVQDASLESEAPQHPASSPSPANGQSPQLAGVRILVVDDEPDALRVLTRVLEQAGARVQAVASAGAAIAAIRQAPPQILISDISMPEQDGYALIEQIRQLPPHQGGRIPAIALTAFARHEDRRRALQSGFDVHLAKPIDTPDLIATITRLLRDTPHPTPSQPAIVS